MPAALGFMTPCIALQESERLLDEAIQCTFPASDPIAVQSAFEAACEREDLRARDLKDG